MFKKLLFSILFVTSTAIASADNKIVGHLEPLPTEKLDNPVKLDCGATVIERSSSDRLDVKRLNRLCTHARSNFFKFLEWKKLKVNNKGDFSWDISMLRRSSDYRELNDLKYRFRYRPAQFNVTGYTDFYTKYIFTISEQNNSEYNVSFVHELFHAMSMYYGLYESHGSSWRVRDEKDEVLARQFTAWLGYGT